LCLAGLQRLGVGDHASSHVGVDSPAQGTTRAVICRLPPAPWVRCTAAGWGCRAWFTPAGRVHQLGAGVGEGLQLQTRSRSRRTLGASGDCGAVGAVSAHVLGAAERSKQGHTRQWRQLECTLVCSSTYLRTRTCRTARSPCWCRAHPASRSSSSRPSRTSSCCCCSCRPPRPRQSRRTCQHAGLLSVGWSGRARAIVVS
jgi:hypothetical protein